MGMTITEKILAKSSGKSSVVPGENLWLNVDVLMTHDVCGPPTIGIWKKEFGDKAKIWDKQKLVIFPDHYIFTKNPHANRNVEILRTFAKEYDIQNYYDVGTERYKGVCHIALAEEGYNIPGTVLFGTDSHTCTSGAFGMFSTGVGNTDAAFILGTGKIWDITTNGGTYRALEFNGEGVSSLSMDERMTLTNMAIEAGAMNGIIEADETVEKYVKERSNKEYEIFKSDGDAKYKAKYRYNANELIPLVAKPHSPDNIDTVENVKGRKLTKCYIGSCTGGKLSDFVSAAKFLFGNKVRVPTFIVPASTYVAEQLEVETISGFTLKSIFEKAGCVIAQSSCAACLGGPMDTIGRAQDGEVIISTTNRNFPGRMGSKKAEVYLASPLTVAASSLTGEITDPRDYM
jgi:3-isopropylmalate/(R)-2-methylmalate dehydratase large subunit